MILHQLARRGGQHKRVKHTQRQRQETYTNTINKLSATLVQKSLLILTRIYQS